jgi:small subunit ribosomal protein S7
MPRRRVPPKRETEPDVKYNSKEAIRFIIRMMERGKKSTSTRVLYAAFKILQEKTGKEPVEVFVKALANVKPMIEVKSRRVGGSTYQVPVEIRESRQEALAMRWIITFARSRKGRSMSEKLSAELLEAFNNTGNAVKKKEDTHKMAEANKAFAHYRW